MRAAQAEPERIMTGTVDLSDFDAAVAMAREVLSVCEQLHVLVNCAGVMPDGPFLEETKETFDLVFAVKRTRAASDHAGRRWSHGGTGWRRDREHRFRQRFVCVGRE
jgi:NAD(P)-dependent dehydrogenase (short-subunit alcohol dehydrogenase family)